MNTYFFIDKASGEEFFVTADTLAEAKEIASRYFYHPRFIEQVSEEYAEAAGLDTY